MAVTVIVAGLAAIALPMLASATIVSNENTATLTLRRIAAAQKKITVASVIDSDSNGAGEHGFLQELSGMRTTRFDSDNDGVADSATTKKAYPPVLSSSFGDVDDEGLLQRSGYYFRLYLPKTDLDWEKEPRPTEDYQGVSAQHSARYWACYAWPVHYGTSGNRAFFINQAGRVLECDNDPTHYSGIANDPDKAAVLAAGGDGKMNSPLAIDVVGEDGNTWRIIE